MERYSPTNVPFVNPYNFIESDFGACERGEMSFGDLTGVIKCTLIAKSDLIIPGLSIDVLNGHTTYDFFKVGNEYRIPGSSLRGVIRSNYEALTNSCYVTARSADPLHARDGSRQAKKPGLLVWEGEGENKTLALYTAKRYMLWTGDYERGRIRFENGYQQTHYNYDYTTGRLNGEDAIGKELRFSAVTKTTGRKETDVLYVTSRNFPTDAGMVKEIYKNEEKSQNGSLTGYLCPGEQFSRKHHESIFTKGTKVDCSASIISKAVENYKKVIDLYQSKAINKNNEGHTWYKLHKQKFHDFEKSKTGAFPVWYRQNGQILQLSPGQISRTVFTRSERDLIGKLAPCTDRENLCPACRLFGMIADEEQSHHSAASRIRVSDATIVTIASENGQLSLKTLAELSSPKPSYMGFYTSNATRDTTYDSNGVRLRGRKYYWSTDRTRPDAGEAINRNASFQVMPKGSQFCFNVYFDRINETELSEILWVLTMGENRADGRYCLHIGHGKPLGYGSAKVTVDKIIKRTSGAGNGWEASAEENPAINDHIFREAYQKPLLEMSNIEFRHKDKISYPYIVNPRNSGGNAYAAHRWFGRAKEDRVNLPTIEDTVGDNETLLKAYALDNAPTTTNGGGNRNGNPNGHRQPNHQQGGYGAQRPTGRPPRR